MIMSFELQITHLRREPLFVRGGGGGGGELVTRLQARRALQSILNRRNKGNVSIHTIKAGVANSTDGSSKVKRVHSKTKTGCYKNMLLLSE